MAKERVVVVGAGGISNSWFPLLLQEKLQIIGVVDRSIDAARRQIEKYNLSCEPHNDVKTALEKLQPDFACDLTVPEAHCEVTCAALKAGCHVVSEKPMSATMQQARKMIRTAEETGKMYMVSQSRRWSKNHEVVHRVLQNGKVGAITTLNCDFYLGAHFGGFRAEMPSPLILDMAIHHFDLARYFSGLDPVSVYAHEFNPKGSWSAGDIAASCIFEMSNSAIFTYRGSWSAEGFHTSWNGDWRIIGDKGTLLQEQEQPPRGQVVAGDTGFHRPLKDLKIPAPRLKFTAMHGALREMLQFLRTGQLPQTECHDNIKSLAMVFAAIESSKKGKRIPIVL